MIIRDIPTFDYFDAIVPSFEGKRILDFGCNKGNLLRSSDKKLLPSQYTGIDIDSQAIAHANVKYPEATWLHYNRKNLLYHPTGDASLPVFDQKFDLILSYSVFSHMDIEDTVEVLECLYDGLTPGGSIYFSYCNIDRSVCTDYFIDRRNRKYGHCDPLTTSTYLYLINEHTSKSSATDRWDFFVAFYNEEWLLDKLAAFKPSTIAPPKLWYQECMRGEWFQDCIRCVR